MRKLWIYEYELGAQWLTLRVWSRLILRLGHNGAVSDRGFAPWSMHATAHFGHIVVSSRDNALPDE